MQRPRREAIPVNAWTVLIIVLFTSSLCAQEGVSDEATGGSGAPLPVQVFKGPRPKDISLPLYPRRDAEERNEGWVLLNFMIDPKGKLYEVVVTDSTGNPAFERAALKAAEEWTFEPASIDGKPIDAGHNFTVTFKANAGKGASVDFVRGFRRLQDAANTRDRALADQELAQLRATNLYELAYLGLGKFGYYYNWGTEKQQIAALRQAIAADNSGARYLPKDLYAFALQGLLPLELRAKDFAAAMSTWKKLRDSKVDKTVLEKYQKAIADLETLRTDTRAYTLSGEIDRGSSWFFGLYKRSFRVVVTSGRVSEIKLRCDKQYVFFPFDPELKYEVADRFGACAIELVGEPRSTFEFIQS
jgi:TonB family protein